MGELVKHHGDLDGTLNDPNYGKAIKLDLRGLKENISKTLTDSDNSDTYTLK